MRAESFDVHRGVMDGRKPRSCQFKGQYLVPDPKDDFPEQPYVPKVRSIAKERALAFRNLRLQQIRKRDEILENLNILQVKNDIFGGSNFDNKVKTGGASGAKRLRRKKVKTFKELEESSDEDGPRKKVREEPARRSARIENATPRFPMLEEWSDSEMEVRRSSRRTTKKPLQSLNLSFAESSESELEKSGNEVKKSEAARDGDYVNSEAE